MSYVQANTSNPLGRRDLSGMWENLPQPYYPLSRAVSRLNGLGDPHDGAVTYRINPGTGRYEFYRTDIKPRGVFPQNIFQHPMRPSISPLGVRVTNLSGLGCGGSSCSCHGKCHRNRRGRGPQLVRGPQAPSPANTLPWATSSYLTGPRFDLRRRRRGLSGPLDGCTLDADGNFTCPPDTSNPNAPSGSAFQPGGIFSDPSTFASGPSPTATAINAIAQGIQQVSNAVAPPRVVVPPQPASWWDQKTLIGGTAVSNPVLAAAAVGFAFVLAGAGKGRR